MVSRGRWFGIRKVDVRGKIADGRLTYLFMNFHCLNKFLNDKRCQDSKLININKKIG